MSKQFRQSAKRTVSRIMTVLKNHNSASGDVNVRVASEASTLVRTIIQGMVFPTATNAQPRSVFLEIWRRGTNVTFPAMDIAGDVAYADNKDLLWKGIFGSMRISANEMSGIAINIDMKGNRKLGRDDSLILRSGGDTGVSLDAIVTTFYKEV